MFNSLKTKMILMVGLPILLINLSLLFFSVSQQQKVAVKQAEDHFQARTIEQSTELQALLESALNSANLTAAVFSKVYDLENTLDLEREPATLILKGVLGKNENFAGVFSVWETDAFDMCDPAYEGLPGSSDKGRFSPYWANLAAQGPVLKSFSENEITGHAGWYEAFRKNPRPQLVWWPDGTMLESESPVLRAITPVINEGVFLGVVGVDIGSDVLEPMVSSWSDPSRETTVHLHTITGELMFPDHGEDCRLHEFHNAGQDIEGIYWVNDVLVKHHLIGSSLAEPTLVVTRETPRHILLDPIVKKLQKNILLMVALVFPTLVLVGYFIRANLDRLVDLKRFTRQVTLGAKVEQVIDTSQDEIGQLNRDIQSMVTSLQDAEAERTESLLRLEVILDSVQAGVVIIDPASRTIVDANPAALNMLGRTKDEALGKICHGFMCPSACNRCPILDLDVKIEGDRKVLLRQDGSELKIFKTVVTIELKGKNYILETFVDVDKQVKAEQALEDKLAQISKAKNQQDVLVSHAVNREERMVALKSEVNELRLQMGLSQRYKAPVEIENWRRELAEVEVGEHQDA